ncbi:serine protease inhibitor-like [Clytia hemisphaerica]|uniref:Serpin domain-containing protein n=1 Tax=Clytia hemisphaerica TaxID=252671 RepID=A0A7M5UMV6_9CNID
MLNKILVAILLGIIQVSTTCDVNNRDESGTNDVINRDESGNNAVVGRDEEAGSTLRKLEEKMFTQLLRDEQRKEKKNMVYSPYGIFSIIKSMSALLDKEHRAAVKTALGLDPNHVDVIKPSITSPELKEANKIWIDSKFELDSEMKKKYKQIIEQIVMKGHVTETRDVINKWVSNHTMGMIRELLTPDSIITDYSVLVVNTLAFHGHWKMPFKPEQTKEMDFHLSENEKVKVKMMFGSIKGRFHRGENFEIVEIPYAGDRYSFCIVLPGQTDPAKRKDITEILESKMTRPIKIQVFLPKFKITSDFVLNKVLRTAGFNSLFSRIAAVKNADINFMDVIQKVAIEVNEEGTKASAGSLGASGRSMPLRVTVDRPFEFMIRDVKEKKTLFHGFVQKPEFE